jgi:hypothetical protein
MSTLVQIGIFVLQLSANIHTYNFNFVCKVMSCILVTRHEHGVHTDLLAFTCRPTSLLACNTTSITCL